MKCCSHCGQKCSSSHGRTKYCSKNCKSKAYYARNKDLAEFRSKRVEYTRKQREQYGDVINARRRERFVEDAEYRARVRKAIVESRARRPQADNNRIWQLANPFKVMLKNLRKRGKRLVSSKDLQFIFERDNYICQYCGTQIDLSLDHKMPVSRGGDSTRENLCIACRPCNSSKGTKSASEFMQYLEEIA